MTDLLSDLEACPFCGTDERPDLVTSYPQPTAVVFAIECNDCGARTAWCSTSDLAERKWNRRTHHAEIAAAVRDAKRWRYVVENSEWIRDEEDTLMAVRFEDARPNLESVGMRTDAIDTAMRAGEGSP